MEKKQTRAQLERELKAAGDATRAVQVALYFKTGEGEYGEGDVFLGIPVPAMRRIALKYRALTLADLQKMLDSKIHDHRAAALEILAAQYARGNKEQRKEIVDFYLRNTSRVNNWDLVDTSARPILGEHLKSHPRKILRTLATSESLWERRIAIVSTMTLVWGGELDDAMQIAEMLLDDRHDLIHKAVGWVLREAGIEDRERLVAFLEKHYARMPRTALRYAIEHFPPGQRKKLLAGDFNYLSKNV
jgi:3-methyladenine DNA glycosylase AlkD